MLIACYLILSSLFTSSRAELAGPERNCTLIWGKWEGSWTVMVRQKTLTSPVRESKQSSFLQISWVLSWQITIYYQRLVGKQVNQATAKPTLQMAFRKWHLCCFPRSPKLPGKQWESIWDSKWDRTRLDSSPMSRLLTNPGFEKGSPSGQSLWSWGWPGSPSTLDHGELAFTTAHQTKWLLLLHVLNLWGADQVLRGCVLVTWAQPN